MLENVVFSAAAPVPILPRVALMPSPAVARSLAAKVAAPARPASRAAPTPLSRVAGMQTAAVRRGAAVVTVRPTTAVPPPCRVAGLKATPVRRTTIRAGVRSGANSTLVVPTTAPFPTPLRGAPTTPLVHNPHHAAFAGAGP
jgi:hypothetical protein